MQRRAYSYIRFSTAEQLKGDSRKRQISKTEAFCEKHGLVLDTSLHLHKLNYPAYRGDNADKGALKAFRDAIESKHVKKGSVLIVESLDRLSRNQIMDAIGLFTSILSSGVAIATLEPEREYSTALVNKQPFALMEAILYFVRANEESATKSMRVAAAWQSKRDRIGTEKMSAAVPYWLKLSEDRKKFILIPEARATIKRIVKLVIDGMGLGQIAKLLNKECVPMVGKTDHWHKSYVGRIVRNRALIGEYTPKRHISRNKRVPCAEPIPDYFPAAISEADFYKAQEALKSRRNQRGPQGKRIANLFTGLIYDARDGSKSTLAKKGSRSPSDLLVSSAAQRGLEGASYISFPYDNFEAAILQWTRELKLTDVAPKVKKNNVDDLIEELEGKLAGLVHQEKKLEDRLMTDPDLEVLAGAARKVKDQRVALEARLEQLKADSHQGSADEVLDDAKSLIDLMSKAKGDELIELRMRLKSRIRQLVSEIWMLPTVFGSIRIAEIQVFFNGGGVRNLLAGRERFRGRTLTIALGNERKSPIIEKLDLRQYRTKKAVRETYAGLLEKLIAAIQPQQ